MKFNEERISQLRSGEIAVRNDGTLEQLQAILKHTFTLDIAPCNGAQNVYMAAGEVGYWTGSRATYLTEYSVLDFILPDDTETAEPEFKWGEEVEVRDGEKESWKRKIFVGINPKYAKYKYVCVDEAGRSAAIWIYCRKSQILTLTHKEIADKFGVPIEQLKIVE